MLGRRHRPYTSLLNHAGRAALGAPYVSTPKSPANKESANNRLHFFVSLVLIVIHAICITRASKFTPNELQTTISKSQITAPAIVSLSSRQIQHSKRVRPSRVEAMQCACCSRHAPDPVTIRINCKISKHNIKWLPLLNAQCSSN